MKPSGVLRLLVLVGTLILLLGTRGPSLAYYEAYCGVYIQSRLPCEEPCSSTYLVFTRSEDGPYYLSQPNTQFCGAGQGSGCDYHTVRYEDTNPILDTGYCGCGEVGQFCADRSNCCDSLVCAQYENRCKLCLDNGQKFCDSNADCCTGWCWIDGCCYGL